MQENNPWCAAAAQLARQLHTHQTDKAGVDYFEGHLSTVASMAKTWQACVVGYLHDASEDTPHTVNQVVDMLENICGASLSPTDRTDIATALTLLNHHNAPDRETYIQRIAQNALARAVKLNDLTHNMDLSRLSNPSPKDLTRLERYKKEYTYLQLFCP